MGARKAHCFVVLLGQQRHPPMGGWLAGGTRPSFLHPWWIVCITGRSVGRCPGRLAFCPPRPCSLSLLVGWPSRSAHVLLAALHSRGFVAYRSRGLLDGAMSSIFQGPSALPVLCPIDRTFHIKFGSCGGQKAGMSLR